MDQRRTFSREFKLAAVKKVVEQRLSFREVARQLNIRATYIQNWKNAFEADATLQSEWSSPLNLSDLVRRIVGSNWSRVE